MGLNEFKRMMEYIELDEFVLDSLILRDLYKLPLDDHCCLYILSRKVLQRLVHE